MANWNWDAPRPLVESFQQGLEVNKETFKLLKEINAPVTAVVIVGPYRTGKSYLLNRLAGKNTGFAIGSTIQAMTKGIWVWCCSHPRDPKTCLLLMDTEGLGDPKKGDKNHDVWIFILAVLLSSTLIYNNMKTIDQAALSDLHLITKLSEHMQTQAKPANNSRYRPNFVWAVRDFYLELELDGKPCTADEYLEDALSIKPGEDKWTKKYNQIRQCLRDYFPSRKCFVFPQPLNNMKMVKDLKDLQDSDFDETFLSASKEFCQYVWKNSMPMSFSDTSMKMKVSDLADLCDLYVQKIEKGVVPCIKESVEALKQLRNHEALDKAFQLYKIELDKIKLPTGEASLSEYHQKCLEAAKEEFNRQSLFDDDQEYEKKLVEAVEEKYKELSKHNQCLLKMYKDYLEDLYMPIAEELKSKSLYHKQGGYDKYKNDMKRINLGFQKFAGTTDETKKIYNDFKKKHRGDEIELVGHHEEAIKEIIEYQTELEKEISNLIEEIRKDANQLHEWQKSKNIWKTAGSVAGIGTAVLLGTAVAAPVAVGVFVAAACAGIAAFAGTAKSVHTTMKMNFHEKAMREEIQKMAAKYDKLLQDLKKSISDYENLLSSANGEQLYDNLTNIVKDAGLTLDEIKANKGLFRNLAEGAVADGFFSLTTGFLTGPIAIVTGNKNKTVEKMQEVKEDLNNLKTSEHINDYEEQSKNIAEMKQNLESEV